MALRSRLDAGEPLVGTFIKLPALESAEILAYAGFDFVVIDAEHSPLGAREIYPLLVAFRAEGVPALVRVADHGYGFPQQLLDAGADGVLVPHVESPAAAAAIFPRLVFPPDGTRGLGYTSRAGRWGALPTGLPGYLADGSDSVLRVAMLEDAEALADAAAIGATTGVDALFIGPGDLALSSGLVPGSPPFEDLVAAGIAEARNSGLHVGTAVMGGAQIRTRIQQGCSFLLVGNDAGFLVAGARGAVDEFRRARDEVHG